ncbi:thrombospondin type 3 repeat-containing protein [Spongiivirga citrea]|uniref:T9SS type A sorting domain-containing protein n=1 Tax=Spongiivirga citrea TaxID=1481457 RepID=A0A6M0CW14_9FLAO|nr:thrombospondin type 3 repeat-containing protein [Spongiivirga citrea]NER17960.1 T9SS type A sorting domain-containing protein [Spongiivirga citrea]
MKRFLLVIGLCSCFAMSAQFNENAPWMESVKADAKFGGDSQKIQTSYNLFEISKSFEEYWNDKDHTKKGSGYKPFKRWEYHWSHYADVNGNLPTAKQLWDAFEAKQNSTLRLNPTANWQALGPFEHVAENGRLRGQGRVNVMAIDPNNADVWYAGAPSGGLWKSTDAGTTWNTTTDALPQIGVSGIAIDPNDSNIIYIATGDDDAGDSVSAGVFKSIDGGSTWNQTGLNPSNTPNLMNEIYIDPTNSNILWLATSSGVYKTVDAAVTWERVRTGNILDLKLKPGDSNTLYAVTRSQFYRTTDGGATWTNITEGLPETSRRLVIDVTPANSNVIYVLSAAATDGFPFQGLYKSTDSGVTFTKTAETDNINESNQAWFDLAMAISPTDEDEVYVGCLNVWKSTNGGDNFNVLNSWFQSTPSYTHADIHMLRFFGNILFCGSDGGLYVSTDNGSTFTDKTEGMAISQFYRLSVAKQDANIIIGGLQDNGGHARSAAGQWRNYHGGDGMDNAIDPNNSNILYGMTQNGGSLNITVNGGLNLSAQVSPPQDGTGSAISGNWVTPLQIDSEGNLYSGFDAVYRLNGNAWERVSTTIGTNIDEIIIDPNNPNNIYIVNGRFLRKSIDAGASFSVVGTFDSDISDMVVSNSDSNTLYVTLSNISLESTPNNGAPKVFKSTDGGNTYDDITFDLPVDQPIFAIAHQGRDTNNPIYVGTSLGVYRWDDTLTEWEEYFTGLPNVAVTDMEINLDDEVLTVATYGRGIWQSPIPVQIPDNDIRLLSVNNPAPSQVICGEVIPEIVVANNGANDITSIDFTYSVNGGAVQNTTVTQTITPGSEATVNLPVLSLTAGKYVLDVNGTIANDAFDGNNDLSSEFFVNDFGVTQVVNSFETADDALLSYNEGDTSNSLWERGAPAKTFLNAAATGTNAYVTALTGDHPNNIKSYLVTKCYDFSTITLPVMSFNMAFDLEQDFDIAYVEYTIDQGKTWQVLGTTASQPNWYNSDRTNASSGTADDCQNCPGAQWTGTETTLANYRYDFTANATAGETDLRGESNVIFRFVFQSDPGVTEEGVMIDDFVILGEQDDDDDDNDGVLDVDDNCPLNANANQLDTDGDGIGDVCDTDDDGDGILDVDDNCPLNPNANQADEDGDGIGDLCDDDADNDGVPNADDLCPDTPAGTAVDVTGCPVFTLAANNFSVQTFGETCRTSDNGRIRITAEDTSLTYNIEITGGGGFTANGIFTEMYESADLTAGQYNACITVDGQADYELCFDLIIGEPEQLAVSTEILSATNRVRLSLGGGERYVIQINDDVYTTTEEEITLDLKNTENILTVRTDKDCQGVFKETIVLNNKILIYPNPLTGDRLFVNMGPFNQDKVFISLTSITGQSILRKDFPVIDNKIEVNTGNLTNGAYILNIKTQESLMNFKIIKR